MISSLYPSVTSRSVTILLLLHLCFACGVAGDRYLPTIWEAVVWRKVSTEGLTTLNQNPLRGVPSYYRDFWVRAHFSASLTLLELVKKRVGL